MDVRVALELCAVLQSQELAHWQGQGAKVLSHNRPVWGGGGAEGKHA